MGRLLWLLWRNNDLCRARRELVGADGRGATQKHGHQRPGDPAAADAPDSGAANGGQLFSLPIEQIGCRCCLSLCYRSPPPIQIYDIHRSERSGSSDGLELSDFAVILAACRQANVLHLQIDCIGQTALEEVPFHFDFADHFRALAHFAVALDLAIAIELALDQQVLGRDLAVRENRLSTDMDHGVIHAHDGRASEVSIDQETSSTFDGAALEDDAGRDDALRCGGWLDEDAIAHGSVPFGVGWES